VIYGTLAGQKNPELFLISSLVGQDIPAFVIPATQIIPKGLQINASP